MLIRRAGSSVFSCVCCWNSPHISPAVVRKNFRGLNLFDFSISLLVFAIHFLLRSSIFFLFLGRVGCTTSPFVFLRYRFCMLSLTEVARWSNRSRVVVVTTVFISQRSPSFLSGRQALWLKTTVAFGLLCSPPMARTHTVGHCGSVGTELGPLKNRFRWLSDVGLNRITVLL